MQYWRNIKKYYNGVNASDIAAGNAAYPAYHEMMLRVSTHYGIDQTRTTEAFAALSPNNDYFGNLRSLVSLIEGVLGKKEYIISTYKACGLRAEKYITGEVDFLTSVKGKKIRAFRNCIVKPDTCTEFVLDGHMIAIALGKAMTMSNANLAIQKIGYETLAKPYRALAKREQIRLPIIQATLWHCRKRTERIKFNTQRDFWYDDNHLLYLVSEIPPYKKAKK